MPTMTGSRLAHSARFLVLLHAVFATDALAQTASAGHGTQPHLVKWAKVVKDAGIKPE